MPNINYGKAFTAGFLVGLIMGLVDTYGYATTGYTTAELSIITTPLLIKLILGRSGNIREVIVGTVVAYGLSYATIITSGMLVTFAYTKMIYEKYFYGTDFPSWLYSEKCFLNVLCPYIPTYIFIGLLSLPGISLAYIYRHLLLDKLQLPYPFAITSFITSGVVSNLKSYKEIYLLIISGLISQFIIFYLGEPSIDLTEKLNTVLKGSVMSLSISFIMLYLSIVLPARTSFSIGFSSLLTSLFILPLGAYVSLYNLGRIYTIDEILYRASWYIASIVFGSVLLLGTLFIYRVRGSLVIIWRISREKRDLYLIALTYLGFVSLFLSTLIYGASLDIIHIIASLVWVLLLLPILIILTTIAVGEAGIAGQSLYPFNTVYLYLLGFRGFTPYIFMDHYLGIPMPGSLSSASANIMKISRLSGTPLSRLLILFTFSFTLGLAITMFYGIVLLKVFGLESPQLSLLRWLPYVNWSIMVYKGLLDYTTIGGGLIIGALYMATILLISMISPIKISPIPFIIGMSLTPDYGILFIIGSFIRWYLSKFGVEVQEKLSIYSIALLVGSGLAIPIYIIYSLFTG
jgi:hypothetical protein